MSRATAAPMCVGIVLLAGVCLAQGASPSRGAPAQGPSSVLWPPQGMVPVTDRLSAMTLQGTIVEITCFRKMGAATVANADQVTCAKDAVAKKTGVVGILTEGDGLFKLVGPLTADNYGKFVPLLGKRVDMPGAEVVLSNNFDYHAFEPKSFAPAKK